MSNPIRLFENLRDMYLRYLDSPFDRELCRKVTKYDQKISSLCGKSNAAMVAEHV